MYKTTLGIGKVWHKRYSPTQNEFNYNLTCWLINLNDLEALQNYSKLIALNSFSLYSFNEKNYFRDLKQLSLNEKILLKFKEFNVTVTSEDNVYFLGQLANLGLYFSPINLYILMRTNKVLYVLVEVSNTPWNERHYYILNMSENLEHNKMFHVSPFFDLNQQYKWSFEFLADKISFQINSFYQSAHVFSAAYTIKLLDPAYKKKILLQVLLHPLNYIKILSSIYWQALRLWIKKTPIYTHPKSK